MTREQELDVFLWNNKTRKELRYWYAKLMELKNAKNIHSNEKPSAADLFTKESFSANVAGAAY